MGNLVFHYEFQCLTWLFERMQADGFNRSRYRWLATSELTEYLSFKVYKLPLKSHFPMEKMNEFYFWSPLLHSISLHLTQEFKTWKKRITFFPHWLMMCLMCKCALQHEAFMRSPFTSLSAMARGTMWRNGWMNCCAWTVWVCHASFPAALYPRRATCILWKSNETSTFSTGFLCLC